MASEGWYNHQYRHSGIRYLMPARQHNGQTNHIRRHRATCCWRQPEVVWIHPPAPANDAVPATVRTSVWKAAGMPSFLVCSDSLIEALRCLMSLGLALRTPSHR